MADFTLVDGKHDGYSRIYVNNNGWYDINLYVEYGKFLEHCTDGSGKKTCNQSAIFEMTAFQPTLQHGMPMRPRIHAIGGIHVNGTPVNFDPDGPTAYFFCNEWLQDAKLHGPFLTSD